MSITTGISPATAQPSWNRVSKRANARPRLACGRLALDRALERQPADRGGEVDDADEQHARQHAADEGGDDAGRRSREPERAEQHRLLAE